MKKIYASLLIGIFFLSFVNYANAQVYLSAGDGDWHDGATWVGGVAPSDYAANIVIVNTGHHLTIATNYYGIGGTIIINTTASLTQTAGFFGELTGTCSISGDFITSGGTFNGPTTSVIGTVTMNQNGGSVPAGVTWGPNSLLKLPATTNALPVVPTNNYNELEIVSSGLTGNLELPYGIAGMFNDITITNTGSFAVMTDNGDETTVSGDLYIATNGKLIIKNQSGLTVEGTLTNVGGIPNLIIESDLDGTGSLITDQAVSGTLNQHISKGSWHLVSPAFTGVESYDFWDGSNDAYMRPYLSPGDGWGDYYGDPSVSLNVGEGYEIWETEDFNYIETGVFNNGPYTLNVSQGGSESADWCLVGNPYPSGLDWGLVDDKTNCVGSAFYAYRYPGYIAHNGVTGAGSGSVGNAPSGIIPSMQGFFVKSNGGGNISLTNNDRAHPENAFYKAQKEIPDYINNLIEITAEIGEQKFTTISYQQEEATNGEDVIYDVPLLFNNDPSFMEFYSLAGELKACINIYNDYPYSMPLGFSIPEGGGEMTLTATDFQNIDGTFDVLLEDIETGATVDLLETPTYSILFSEGGIVDDRFILHLNSTVGFDDVKDQMATIYSNKNRIYLDINDVDSYDVLIVNMMGQTVYSQQLTGSGLKSITLDQPAAYYLVTVITQDENITKKLYITK